MYKSVILAVSAFAALGYTQSVPTCGQSCVTPPATCNLIDVQCICTDAEWIASAACCIFENCPDEADRQQALAFGNSICNPVGATLPTTTSSCPASTGTSSATGTSSGAAASASASASSVLSSVSSATASASSALSSALSSASTAAAGGASTSSALATRIAVADGVGIVGALLGVAALL